MRKKRKHPTAIPVPDGSEDFEIFHDNQELMPDENASKSKNGAGAVVVHHLVTALQLTMVLVLGAWGYLTYRDVAFFTPPNPEDRSSLQEFAVEGQVVRLEFALSVYYALNEKYPASMTTLVDEGLLVESDLTYPGDEDRYKYQRFGDGYKLIVDRSTGIPAQPDADADALIFEE